MTCRVWDVRYLASSLCTLKGRLGAMRSLRFTSDGRSVQYSTELTVMLLHNGHMYSSLCSTLFSKHSNVLCIKCTPRGSLRHALSAFVI